MKPMNRLQNAFAPVSDDFQRHVVRTLDNMEELTMEKAKYSISAVALALIIVLITGVALAAAARFGVLDFITHEDHDGNPVVNEEVLPLVQPLEQTHEGESTKLTVHDALCDGGTLAIAWTIENKRAEDVIVVWHPIVEGGAHDLGAGIFTLPAFLVEGGESYDGGMSLSLEPAAAGDVLHVDLVFSVLLPNQAVQRMDGPSNEMTPEEEAIYAAEKSNRQQNGAIVLEAGIPSLPDGEMHEGEHMDEALLRLGLARQLDAFNLPFELGVTGGAVDILAFTENARVDLDGYSMILSSAECSTTTLRYTVDYVFSDGAKMEAFKQKRSAIALFPLLDNESEWFSGAGTGDPERIVAEDGTLILRYATNIENIWTMPDEVEIIAKNVITRDTYNENEVLYLKIPK